MDRNLGALSASPSDNQNLTGGNLYIYGRPTPMPTRAENRTYNASGKVIGWPARSGISGYSLVSAISNPRMMVVNTYDLAMEGNPYQNKYWFNPTWNEGTSSTSQYEKSLFDPCPPGWKVPRYAVWDSITKVFAYQSTVDHYGFLFYANGQNGETMYYPSPGCYYPGYGSLTYISGNSNACSSYLGYDDYRGMNLGVNRATYHSCGYDKAGAYCVRCIQE